MLKNDRAVLFVHVPKTGGSTIEKLFTESGWAMRWRATRDSAPRLFPHLRVSPQHYHGALLQELVKPSSFDLTFLVVRDPIARFRSEFAMRNTKLERADAATVDAWADDVLGRYADNPYVHDNHLRPQAEFLVPGTEVFRLEDGLEEIVADLNARHLLDLTSPIRRALSSASRGLPSSAVEISDGLRRRLEEFYAVDYETFDYPR